MRAPRGKKERSRLQIMQAAKGLFNEKGVQNVTFNEIAQRVDMCRTTIFNHFSTINDLQLALMAQEVEEVMEYCEETGLSGDALVAALFDRLIDDVCEYPKLTQRLIANSILNEGDHAGMEKLGPLVIKNLTGKSRKEKEDKLIVLAGIFMGLINRYALSGKEFDAKEMKRRYAKLTAGVY